MNTRPAYPLVRIFWHDSRRPLAEWIRLEDAIDILDCECVSVGYLIHETDARKLLAPNVADVSNDPQACAIIAIPSAAITHLEILEGGRDEA